MSINKYKAIIKLINDTSVFSDDVVQDEVIVKYAEEKYKNREAFNLKEVNGFQRAINRRRQLLLDFASHCKLENSKNN